MTIGIGPDKHRLRATAEPPASSNPHRGATPMRRRPPESNQASAIDRRHFLGQATAVAGTTAVVGGSGLAAAPALAADGTAVVNGQIKQSIVFWCFNTAGEKWDADRTCQVAQQLGVTSIELLAPELWPTLKKYGIRCAIAPNGMPGACRSCAVSTIPSITTR